MRRTYGKGIVLGAATAVVTLVATSAVAGTGIGSVFNLGRANTVNAQTTLKGATAAGTLQLTNTGTGRGLGVTVRAGKAPIVVNASAGKATNLNADKLDGLSSADFGRSTGTAAEYADECDTPDTWNECATVQVVVPAGKAYAVSVWTSATWLGITEVQNVEFCAAAKGPGATEPSCITPFEAPFAGDRTDIATVQIGQFANASSLGEAVLTAGTWTVGLAVRTASELAESNVARILTTVQVRNASAPGPATGLRVQKAGASALSRPAGE